MWYLSWTKWNWDRYFTKYHGFPVTLLLPLLHTHSYITNATQSFIHSFYHQQCQQWITTLMNTVKKSMFVEATRSHTHKRTDRKAQETCFAEEYSGQALPVHSHWMALNLRQLPIFQGDKSCVFQQDSTQLHNFRSINLLLEWAVLKTDSTLARNITLLHIVGPVVCNFMCMWRSGGGWVYTHTHTHTHVHARKPTTVQQVKDIVTNKYSSIIPLEICEKGWKCPCEMLIAPPSLWLKV